MGRKKGKHKKTQQRAQVKTTIFKSTRDPLYKRMNSFLLWLAATGILTIISSFTVDFLVGDVQVEYIKPLGRSYEFKFINNSSTDQIVEVFKIFPDPNQKLIFKTNKDIYGKLSENGLLMPGGNSTYIPAYEYDEMNNYVLPANSEKKFRVPPLSARDYMTPESVVVFVEYSTKSNNKYMAKLESVLMALRLKEGRKRKKYLVVDNYWTPISNDNKIDALKLACRDNDIFAKSIACQPYHKSL